MDNNDEPMKINDMLDELKDKSYEKVIFNLENSKKELLRRVFSLTLSVAITISGSVGIYLSSKRNAYRDYYNKSVTTYSQTKGIDTYRRTIDVSEVDDKNLEQVYLNFYSMWKQEDGGFRRIVKRYNVSDYKFDNISDYIEKDIDYTNLDCEIIEEFVEKINFSKLYVGNYVEVEKNSIDKSDVVEYFDPVYFVLSLTSSYVIYLFLLYGVIYFTDDWFVVEQFDDVIDSLKSYVKNKKISKSEFNKILKLNNDILNIVKKDRLLEKKFCELYENNKFLLDEPEVLYDKFFELVKQQSGINVKKLTKEKA